MKHTQYFLHTRNRPDRKSILDEWIVNTVENPDFEEIQSDGRIRRWKKIESAEGRYLRVILLADGETLHNAFFDRGFKKER
jgi:hypothetical protein